MYFCRLNLCLILQHKTSSSFDWGSAKPEGPLLVSRRHSSDCSLFVITNIDNIPLVLRNTFLSLFYILTQSFKTFFPSLDLPEMFYHSVSLNLRQMKIAQADSYRLHNWFKMLCALISQIKMAANGQNKQVKIAHQQPQRSSCW